MRAKDLFLVLLVAAQGFVSINVSAGAVTIPHGDIIWDSYGIPHVFGANIAGLFYGFGYAQAAAHGDLLLRLYGESRGRAAEYWGAEYAESDRYLLANDAWPRARRWYARQSGEMRADLDAFAAGINAYAAEHPEHLSAPLSVVLPVSGIDVIAHWEHVMEFLYLAPRAKVYGAGAVVANSQGAMDDASQSRDVAGSNAWAIAPSRTADGHAMLLSNPHLSWGPSFMTYFEAQLSAPGIDLYGATQVGFPVLRFAFNDDHGLTNTVNPIVAAPLYKLTLAPGGYLYDGKVKCFEQRLTTLKIKQPDGSMKIESLKLRRSVHGPVFTRADGMTVALRVAGLDRPFGIQEYWDLGIARGLDAFITVLKRLQVPMFNMIYADADGHILYQYNGTVPKYGHGDFTYWSSLVPGDTSGNLWTRIHTYEELPRILDPPAGWVQNTNNPPWINTALPALDPHAYPAYLAPVNMTLRAQQSALLLTNQPPLSFDAFVELKMSTRSLMADRLLGPLLEAAAQSADPLVRRAAELLRDWDHRYDNTSRAALLFETWAKLFAGPQFLDTDNFSRPWSLGQALTTPDGIKNPADALVMLRAAARETIEVYGSLDRPFGEVSRFHIGDTNLPGNGGFGNMGIFRVITWGAVKNGERTPVHGETYISMIEFSTPMKAVGLMSYGESSQPDSPHRGDQLELLSTQRLRPVWRERIAIEQHEEARKSF